MPKMAGIERNRVRVAPTRAGASAILPRLVPAGFALLGLALTLLTSACRSGDDEGFAIYLLAQETPPAKLAMLSHLAIDETPLVAGDDLVSYHLATHEMELSPDAYSKIMHLGLPLAGRSFAVCVDGHPVYAGAFVIPLSSMSVDAVVIWQPTHTHESLDHYALRLELGYPGAGFYTGEDPRAAPEIVEALERDKKLR